MEPTELTAAGIVFTVLGGILTKFIDYLLKKSKDERLAESEKDERLVAAYSTTIGKMELRMTAMENDLKLARHEHVECLQKQAELRADITILETKLAQVQKKQRDSDVFDIKPQSPQGPK